MLAVDRRRRIALDGRGQDGVELLSDLGGDIYLKLGSQRDPSTIEGRLARYFEDIL